MKADDMTLAVFDAMLKKATFKALTKTDYQSFAGATDRALMANFDDCDILLDEGLYHVYGYDDDADWAWCVTFTYDGEREHIV